VLSKYENDYFRANQIYPGELTGRIHHLTRQQQEEVKDLDISCIQDERNEVSLDELDRSLDLELDYELDLAEYQQELREFV
jgi:hypothetical protein